MGVRNAVVTHNPLQSELPVQWKGPSKDWPSVWLCGGLQSLSALSVPSEACSMELAPAIPGLARISLARMADIGMGPCWGLLGKEPVFPWWCRHGLGGNWLGGRQPKSQSVSTT